MSTLTCPRDHAACFLPLQIAVAALQGLLGPVLHPSMPGSPQDRGRGFSGAALLGAWPQLGPARVWDSVRSWSETGRSWREWQGCKELLEDPLGFVYIQVGTNTPLGCYNGTQLTNWKASSILQGDRRLPVLVVCSKIILFFS